MFVLDMLCLSSPGVSLTTHLLICMSVPFHAIVMKFPEESNSNSFILALEFEEKVLAGGEVQVGAGSIWSHDIPNQEVLLSSLSPLSPRSLQGTVPPTGSVKAISNRHVQRPIYQGILKSVKLTAHHTDSFQST